MYTVWNDDWTEHYVISIDGSPIEVEFDEDGGTDDRNWILFDTCTQVTTAIESPPVVLVADVTVFSAVPGETTIELTFSEDIDGFDSADMTLTGDSSGSQIPTTVSYNAGAQTALVTYAGLPDDAYAFVVLAAAVSANGKQLDGEMDDSVWWDNILLPSGDGQPGGDTVLTFNKLTGDSDFDGDIDYTDFANYTPCLSGPDNAHPANCGVFDFNADGDSDVVDFAAFQPAFTGS